VLPGAERISIQPVENLLPKFDDIVASQFFLSEF
jgi:hypothetical protein